MQCVYPSKKKTKHHGIHDLERRNGAREETERGKKEDSFLSYRKSHHPLVFHKVGCTAGTELASSEHHWCVTNCCWPLTWSHLLKKTKLLCAHLCETSTSCLW